jgi:hypothetical protein
VFRFQAPDRRFAFALTFRQSSVQHDDLVAALEEILAQLRELERGDDVDALGGRKTPKTAR